MHGHVARVDLNTYSHNWWMYVRTVCSSLCTNYIHVMKFTFFTNNTPTHVLLAPTYTHTHVLLAPTHPHICYLHPHPHAHTCVLHTCTHEKHIHTCATCAHVHTHTHWYPVHSHFFQTPMCIHTYVGTANLPIDPWVEATSEESARVIFKWLGTTTHILCILLQWPSALWGVTSYMYIKWGVLDHKSSSAFPLQGKPSHRPHTGQNWSSMTSLPLASTLPPLVTCPIDPLIRGWNQQVKGSACDLKGEECPYHICSDIVHTTHDLTTE